MTLYRDMTQEAYMLDLLKSGRNVCSDQLRAAYVSNPSLVAMRLKQDRWNIETNYIKVRGKRRAVYSLNREQPRIEVQERASRRMPDVQPVLQRLRTSMMTI